MNVGLQGPVVLGTLSVDISDPDIGCTVLTLGEQGQDSGHIDLFFRDEQQIEACIEALNAMAAEMRKARPRCPVVEIKP